MGTTGNSAEPLNLSPRATVVRKPIGGNTPVSLFRMRFRQRSSVDLEFRGLKDTQVRIDLQRRNGAAVESVRNRGRNRQVLARTVDQGVYFLQVSAQQGRTRYTLNGLAHPDAAGDSRRTAPDLKLRARPTNQQDFVGRSDPQDYYRLDLGRSREVNLSLDKVQEQVRLLLLNRQGQVLARSVASRNRAAQLTEPLDKGTYYARVVYGGNQVGTRYTLTGSVADPFTPKVFTQQWVQQFGTSSNDYAYDIQVDAEGRIYVVGSTNGALQGSNQGGRDAFIALADPTGNIQSIQQFGTANSDVFSGVALGSNGRIYAAGAQNVAAPRLGNLRGSGKGAIAIYGRSGNQLNASQQVSFSEGNITAGSHIAIDQSNSVYVAGGALNINFLSVTSKAFVVKYNRNGRPQSLHQDIRNITNTGAATSVAVDAQGNIYVAGVTNARIQADIDNPYTGGDAFVAKFDSSGKQLWFDTLGTPETDTARRLAVDRQGNVYVVGNTEGALPGNSSAGGVDAFVAKYNSNGRRQWVNQFGTPGLDEAQGVAVDAAGNVYVTGETAGSLFGNLAGDSDAWIVKYDPQGRQVAATQIGTNREDETYGITVDANGHVYVVGQTLGSLGGINQGGYDVWMAKFALEPT
jgi:hypothetical protein